MGISHSLRGLPAIIQMIRLYGRAQKRVRKNGHDSAYEAARALLCDSERAHIEELFASTGYQTGTGSDALPAGTRNLITQVLEPQGLDGQGCRWVRFGDDYGLCLSYRANPDKLVYLLQGDSISMGFQLGVLGQKAVRAMAEDYANNVIQRMLFPRKAPDPELGNIYTEMVYLMSKAHLQAIPLRLRRELYALFLSSSALDPSIHLQDLLALNYGIDVILSRLYRIPLFSSRRSNLRAYRDPLSCNAFVLDGRFSSNGHSLFGRDFMFATCGVFTHTAAYLVYHYTRPEKGEQEARRPYMHFSTPGFIGSVTGVNSGHMAMGVHLAAGKNTSYRRPGLNSLLLVREALENTRTMDELEEFMATCPRGVSYIYPAAQGIPGKKAEGAIFECGSNDEDSTDFRRYLSFKLRVASFFKPSLLPDAASLKALDTCMPYRNGMAVRRLESSLDPGFCGRYNPRLFRLYGVAYNPDCETPGGCYLSRQDLEKVLKADSMEALKLEFVPGQYFFPPQREQQAGILFASNHFIAPQLRMLGMSSWISLLQRVQKNDSESQWRYDELNREINTLVSEVPAGLNDHPEESSGITVLQALRLIDYLNPFATGISNGNLGYIREQDGSYRKSANYLFYGIKHSLKAGSTGLPQRPDEVEVNGGISLVDLHDLSITSRWGHYSDDWHTLDFSAIRNHLEAQ